MTRAFILHGTEGSPNSNWFPWLKDVLERRDVTVTVPRFQTPDRQSLESWRGTFMSDLGKWNKETNRILIGHSCGATLALRVLEENFLPITATYLVSGFVGPIGNEKYDKLNETFFEQPFGWPTIKKAAGKAFVYHGTNDPYVPLHHGETIAKGLGVDLIKIPGGKHLNAEAGFTKFERLWQDLEPLLDQSDEKT